MEFHVTKQPVFIHEMLLEAELEQPVECDVLLPDYCEDIQKILKCTARPVITRREAAENRLELEGAALVNVYYRSPEGKLCRGEYRVPFARTAELHGQARSPLIWVQGSCSYVNCRAVSSRRLDIRGAVSLQVTVADLRQEEAVACAEGMGVQLRQQTCPATRVLCEACCPVTLTEETQLPDTKEPAAAVLRVGACARLTDTKIMTGKAVLRGECRVNFLYRDEKGRCQTMELALPLSQIVDAAGAEESCRCHARAEVQNAQVELCDGEGEERRFKVTVNLCLYLRVHREQQVTCAGDCYSTRYECRSDVCQAELLELVREVDHSFLYRDRMELPDGVDRVTDLWCRLGSWRVREEEDSLVLCGKLLVALFGCRGDGDPEYYEKPVEFEERISKDCEGEVIFRPVLETAGQSYSFSGEGMLEVRCELAASGCLYRRICLPMIRDIVPDENKPNPARVEKGLYICRAEAGEELWDIARRYNTDVEWIREENRLTAATLEQRTTLLVPVL